jgi:bifunctional non-homologous end joining protein LigD
VHYVKLDGFRMMVWRDAAGVRLLTRNGIDWTARYPLIATAAGALRARWFLLDGEAMACDGDGTWTVAARVEPARAGFSAAFQRRQRGGRLYWQGDAVSQSMHLCA